MRNPLFRYSPLLNRSISLFIFVPNTAIFVFFIPSLFFIGRCSVERREEGKKNRESLNDEELSMNLVRIRLSENRV